MADFQAKLATNLAVIALCAQPVIKEAAPVAPEPEEAPNAEFALYTEIAKADAEERTVTGVVLQPEVVDAQGDIISEEVIQEAAEKFLANYNKSTKLGLQHKDFKKRFQLLQSFIVPLDMTIGNVVVKKGAWVIKVKVLDDNVWKAVKNGTVTGFSIGGKARVVENPEE